MKHRDILRRTCLVVTLTSVLFSGTVFAQRLSTARRPTPAKEDKGKSDVQVRIKKLKGLGRDNLQRTPEYKTNAYRGVKKAGEWVEVRTEYDTGGAEWADELEFSYYVMCQGKEKVEGKNVYYLYRRVVKYVDVERDNGHFSCVYLRPNTVERFGEPIAVAVVISAGGEALDQKTEVAGGINLPDEWWDSPAVLENPKIKLIIRDGQLLTRDESPWAFVNMDDYEWIKRD